MKQLPFKVRNWTSKEQWRIETFWDKEPETLLWIESFGVRVCNNWFTACNRKIMFFDIGANIGLYSLYAATLYPDLLIFAIEPQLENFQSLIANIKENKFYNIIPVYAGIGGCTGIIDFEYFDLEAGASTGQIKKKLEEKDKLGVYRKLIVYDIDLFCALIGYPTFFKMDIDGAEYMAFPLMARLFEHVNLDSMMIEFKKDSRMNNAVNDILSYNLTMQNEFNLLPNHSNKRRIKEGIGVENIIFTKDRKKEGAITLV